MRSESQQLLEEMLDNGYPLTTEPNALRDIIMPPSLFKKILAVAGTAGSVIYVQPCSPLTVSTRRMAKATPTPFSSPIPWRATGLRYNRNEIFFDVVEEMQGIVGRYVHKMPPLTPADRAKGRKGAQRRNLGKDQSKYTLDRYLIHSFSTWQLNIPRNARHLSKLFKPANLDRLFIPPMCAV